MPSTLRDQPTRQLGLQPSDIDWHKRTEFLGFLGLLDELGAAPEVRPYQPFASRLWLAPTAMLVGILVVVVLISAKAATTRQSPRFAAPSMSALADNRENGGVFRQTSRLAPIQLAQSTFTYASSGFGSGSDSSAAESRQSDLSVGDIEILFSRADADARFATTRVSRPPVVTRPRKIGGSKFAEHNAIVRPDSAGRLSESASAQGNPVFAAKSPKIDEKKPDSFRESAASAVALSNAAARKPITIASAGHLTTWVLTSGGVINRSNDGVRWQPLNSGTDRDLLAGTAPSAEICWVVGRAGTILRTTDGEQWERIPSPAEADLLSVAAADESSATVMTADGRKFATANAGKTWQLTRN
jgi:hypothetical protein